MSLKVEMQVIQKVDYVKLVCPYCGKENRREWQDLEFELGEYCDWQHSETQCYHCEELIEIDFIDWI